MKFAGVSAKCKVKVTKAAVKPTAKPTLKPDVTASPSNTPVSEDTASPDVSEKPTITIAPTNTPAVSSATPEVSPGLIPSVSPDIPPSATNTPVPTETPTATGAVVMTKVAEVDGETMTVYLMDRDYEGGIHITVGDTEFKASGKVKEALDLLQTTWFTKTNSANTIKVSRVYPEKYWSIVDLVNNKTYYMRVEKNNTFDTSYSNCGAIYFKGDVTGDISVY